MATTNYQDLESKLIAYLYFGEKISAREYSGMALVIVSILLLLREIKDLLRP